MRCRPVIALALNASLAACLLAACVEPNNSNEGIGPITPDAAVSGTPGLDAPRAMPDAAPPSPDAASPSPDTASPLPDSAAPSPDRPAPPPDVPPPPPDASPPDAPRPPDGPPSPCPGGPPPPDYGLRCGCDPGVGTVQCSGKCSVDDASCVPTGEFYVLTNLFLGPDKVLDTYGGDPPNNAFMNDPCCTGRLWRITVTPDGTYRLSNMFLGDSRRLETTDGNTLFMGLSGATPTQSWRITGAGGGTFRIRNAALGPGRSLDTKNDPTMAPNMAPTGDFSGQYWFITKN